MVFKQLVALSALAIGTYADRELPRDWNENRVGASPYFKELDSDTLIPWITKNSKNDTDSIVVLYGDQCSHCQELKPMQDRAAKKIIKESTMVAWGRYDLHRFGGAASLIALMEKKYPAWKRLESEGKVLGLNYDNLAIPQMYHFGRSGEIVQQVPHGEIGWGPQGNENLKKWVRFAVQGYEKNLKKKKKSKKAAPAEGEEKKEEL